MGKRRRDEGECRGEVEVGGRRGGHELKENVGGKGQGGVEVKGRRKGGKGMGKGKWVEGRRGPEGEGREGGVRMGDGEWKDNKQALSVIKTEGESAMKSSTLQRSTIFVGFSPTPRIFTFWS